MVLIRAPVRRVFLRPKASPKRATKRQPSKLPREKQLAVIPWMLASLV